MGQMLLGLGAGVEAELEDPHPGEVELVAQAPRPPE